MPEASPQPESAGAHLAVKLPYSHILQTLTLVALKNLRMSLPADCDRFYNQCHAPLCIEKHGAFGGLGHESLAEAVEALYALCFGIEGLGLKAHVNRART